MFRKRALIPILLLLALASIMTAASFSNASIQANGKLNIVDTSNGLIGLQPGTISTIENHQLVLDLSSGLQTNSSYTFNNAFSIKNNSSETVIIRYNGQLLGNYGEVTTKAYLPGIDQYYNNALEEGFPLESGQTAEIGLYINVGDQTVDLTHLEFHIVAEKGAYSNNSPHNGPIPTDTHDGDSGEGSGMIDCKNPGQCLNIAKDLLSQLDQLKAMLDGDHSKDYDNMVHDWFDSLNQMVSELKDKVDKLSENEHNSSSELNKAMDNINTAVEAIIQLLDDLNQPT